MENSTTETNKIVGSFKKDDNGLYGFSYVYEEVLPINTEVVLKMPAVSANKRSVNDIGWMIGCAEDECVNNIFVSGTLSSNPNSENAMWQQLVAGEDVNKTLSGIKIENKNEGNLVDEKGNPKDETCRVVIRVIMC